MEEAIFNIKEALELYFEDDVQQGKVLYIGCSKHPSSLILEALYESERLGAAGFISEQPPYNLLDRRPENELIPTCRRHGVGIPPFVPIAGGLLTGKYRPGRQPEDGRHAKRDPGDDPIMPQERWRQWSG